MSFCEIIVSSLPTIIGALVGASASILTTILTNRENIHLTSITLMEKRKQKAREFEFNNYVDLQNLLIENARKTTQAYYYIKQYYTDGHTWKEALLPDDLSEATMVSGQRLLLNESRIGDDNLRHMVGSFRKKQMDVTIEARTAPELENAMREYIDYYSTLSEKVGNKVREFIQLDL